MTITLEAEITCDGAPGDPPFTCPTAAIYAPTARRALAIARRQGWTDGPRDGRRVHLCPDHDPRRTTA